jgi:hypothetical protein
MIPDAPRARRSGHVRALRLLLLALVALALAPGTFMRAPGQMRSDPAQITVTPRIVQGRVTGELGRPNGVWELTSAHGFFGGFSALVASDGPALIAGSDRGFLLDVDLAGEAPRPVPASFRFVGVSTRGRKEFVDLEALARDPASGTLWAAFENDNLVMRFPPQGRRTIRAPRDIAKWSANSGPETMERLADGRFLMIAEGNTDGDRRMHEALLFPVDPAETGTRPLSFRFVGPAYFDPVDATQLPDGRVLILLRMVEFSIPATFSTSIAIADPRNIRAGGAWEARVIAHMHDGILADNFEGIAFVPSAADPSRGSIWLISDDNFSIFQRTLLVRFAWNGAAIP